MFDVLVESKAKHTRQYRYTIASVLAHSALIAGAAVATAKSVGVERHDPPRAESTIYIAAPDPAPRHTAAAARSDATAESRSIWKEVSENLPQIDLTRIPTELPPVGASIGEILDRVTDDLRESGAGSSSGTAGGGDYGSGGPYTFTQVEQAASLRTVVEPPYPAGLRAAGISGRVVLRLVVDSTGRVDLGTVEVRASASDQFTASVRSILPRLRFTPAMLRGRPVAQLVELPFEFSLRR